METAPSRPSTTANETIKPQLNFKNGLDQAAAIKVIEEQAMKTAPSRPSTTVNETTKSRLNFKNGLNPVAYILNITLVF